ncbi:uncharacterized protein [Macrobrachium rosenbergii]|uniref:Crustin 2 n=1 Tax=Macrobrachium rosenbergii TaxID=79674 RepID=G7Z061_MACRS|nr:crustin type I [Macrobrachium rosenbergii]ANH22231.1 crustin 2 [Macrobrachium rosenbergii]
MARLCVFAIGVLVAVTQVHAQVPGGHLGTCPPPKQPVESCRNYCKFESPGTTGDYYCCDEQRTPAGNPGTCPKVALQEHEIVVMCDPNDTNRPYSLNCKTDADCFQWEKCCYAPVTQQRICRASVFDL